MIIIGEKINGAIPSVSEAIKNRDTSFIVNLVKLQEKAGAHYLDVCAGTSPEEEPAALEWLVNVVQGASERPICIDSPDPKVIENIFPKLKKPGIINSVSGEGTKCEVLLPLLTGNEWQVIALCCNNNGIAADANTKVKLAFELIEKAASYGVTPDRIHIDPLVLAVSAANTSVLEYLDAVRRIKERYPTVKVTAALSNVSFGMPVRKLLNQNFLTLALSAGLDSGIVDPANRDIIATVLAAEVLLGKDRFCRAYNQAYRAGKIGPVKSA